MELEIFNIKKNTILSLYKQIEKVGNALDTDTFQELLRASSRTLLEDSFNLVVVGEFSRGKSTFINALLGGRILPSATKPTTTVINKIHYNDKPSYKLYFRDGQQSSIDEEAFKGLVAGREPDFDDPDEVRVYEDNMKYASKVAYADIGYPLALCKGGVEIIDTPGTNDLDQAREEITFKFIPESDVAILVLSANQILSQSEVMFLKERILSNDIQKVFFVINFKDRLTSLEEQEKVMTYAYEHLKDVIKEPKIYMVSSKDALAYKRVQNNEVLSPKVKVPTTLEETGFTHLEEELATYLLGERANVKLSKYVDRGTKICDELIRDHIQLKMGALGMETKELQARVDALRPKLVHMRQVTREECDRLKSRLAGIQNDLVFQYRTGLETICLSANSVVNQYVGDLEIEKILRAIEQTIAPLQVELHGKMENFKCEYIDREVAYTLRTLSSICDDLNIQVKNELAVVTNQSQTQLGGVNVDDNIHQDINLLENIMVGGAFFAMFSMPLIVIPAAIFGGKHFSDFFANKRRENFLTEVKLQVDKRYGEIIPKQVEGFKQTYNKNIESIINQVQQEMQRRIATLEQQLTSLVSNKEKTEKNEKELYEHLQTLNKQLDTIKKQLREV